RTTWSSRCATTPTKNSAPTPPTGCTGRSPTPRPSTPTTPSTAPSPTLPTGSTGSPPPSASRETTMTDVEHPRHSLSIDQQLALRTAATRLHGEFDGIFGTETIEQFLHSSYDQFASHSTIPNFLPLLAERFARQRLHALAKIEGHHDGKPTVLFLCVHNAGRSQT